MPRLLAAVLTCAALASALAACGEKEEPDFSGADAVEPSPAPADPLADIAGRWEGTLRQRGMPPFTVRVRIASAQQPAANPVAYTGIRCAGQWRFLGRSGDAYRFRETIDRGAGRECKGTGTVTLSARGRELGYRFRGGGVTSRGTLIRSAG
jgi:hypothetical protein